MNTSRLTLCIVLALTACLTSSANQWYVDYASGNDSNNGESKTSAFQHCPGDPMAAGNAASTSLSPGDTVKFKGGVTYVLAGPNVGSVSPGISLNWAGTSGALITYDGNSDGCWGTGQAILTDNYGVNNICAFYSPVGMSNLVFNNFYFPHMGGAATLPDDPDCTNYIGTGGLPPNPGGGISCAGFASNIFVISCVFSNMGYYGSACPLGNASLAGGAIGANGVNQFLITNCVFSQSRDHIFFNNPSMIANLTIANSLFTQCEEWCITLITGTNAYLSNVFICNNLFTNVDQSYSTWTGYGGPPHRDTIFSFGAEGCSGNCALDRNVTDTNVCIYNNLFIDTLNYAGGTAVVWFQDNASVNVYNNLFINTQQQNAAVQFSEFSSNSAPHVLVANNSFYISDGQICLNFSANVADEYTWPVGAPDYQQYFVVENNIIYEWSGVSPYNNAFDYTLAAAGTTASNATNSIFFDYNLYRTGQFYDSEMVYGLWAAYLGYITPITSITGASWDVHSLTGDPLYSDPTGNDLHLGSGSPAIEAGLNLTDLGLPGLTNDFEGNPRPALGAWDMGAYEAPVGSFLLNVQLNTPSGNVKTGAEAMGSDGDEWNQYIGSNGFSEPYLVSSAGSVVPVIIDGISVDTVDPDDVETDDPLFQSSGVDGGGGSFNLTFYLPTGTYDIALWGTYQSGLYREQDSTFQIIGGIPGVTDYSGYLTGAGSGGYSSIPVNANVPLTIQVTGVDELTPLNGFQINKE